MCEMLLKCRHCHSYEPTTMIQTHPAASTTLKLINADGWLPHRLTGAHSYVLNIVINNQSEFLKVVQSQVISETIHVSYPQISGIKSSKIFFFPQ